MSKQPDLFDPPPAPPTDLTGMVHGRPLETEASSAAAIFPKRRAIQQAVMQALAQLGPMTAEQIERLPRFADYGPSTIRKRISELYALGEVVIQGKALNSRSRPMMIWALPTTHAPWRAP